MVSKFSIFGYKNDQKWTTFSGFGPVVDLFEQRFKNFMPKLVKLLGRSVRNKFMANSFFLWLVFLVFPQKFHRKRELRGS